MPRGVFVWETMCARAACVQRANEQISRGLQNEFSVFLLFLFHGGAKTAGDTRSWFFKRFVVFSPVFALSSLQWCHWTSSKVGADFFLSEVFFKGKKKSKTDFKIWKRSCHIVAYWLCLAACCIEEYSGINACCLPLAIISYKPPLLLLF